MDHAPVKKFLAAGSKPAALIVTCTGFFCDFVKPFLNLVPYFFGVSLGVTFVVWLFYIRKKMKQHDLDTLLNMHGGKVFGIAFLSTAFWLIMIPIFAFTPERGIAATAAPGIADFQEQLFGKLDRIETKIDRVLEKIDTIETGNAGLIPKPVTLNDFYHNARFHEINGNLVQAKKAYEEYFKSNAMQIDPYLSYVQILKNLEGPSSAREMMASMRERNPENIALDLAYILSKSTREDRLPLLENLAAKYPDYGPIYYYIAEQYSPDEVGVPTNDERRKEREALQKVLDLEMDQKFSKYFIDKKESDEKMEWVSAEMKSMEGVIGNMIDKSLQIRVQTYGGNATIVFTLSELAQKIYYRVDKQGEFKDTGSMDATMPGLEGPLPNYYVMLPLESGEHVVEAKYVDVKGNESDVVEEQFSL